MLTLQNRERDLDRIYADDAQIVLLGVYGEAGIAKSRLLDEVERRMRAKYPGALVLKVGFKPSADASADRLISVLHSLAAQPPDLLGDHWQRLEWDAEQVETSLNLLDGHRLVILVYDASEMLQRDRGLERGMRRQCSTPDNRRLLIKVQEDGDDKRVSLALVVRKWPRVITGTLAIAVLVLALLLASQLAPTLLDWLLKLLI